MYICLFTCHLPPQREQKSTLQNPQRCPQSRASCVFLQIGHKSVVPLSFGGVFMLFWTDGAGLGIVCLPGAAPDKCFSFKTVRLRSTKTGEIKTRLYFERITCCASFLFSLVALHNFHDILSLLFCQMTKIGHRKSVIHDGGGWMPRFLHSLNWKIINKCSKYSFKRSLRWLQLQKVSNFLAHFFIFSS